MQMATKLTHWIFHILLCMGFETSPQAQNLPLMGNDRAVMNPTINSPLPGTNEKREILGNERVPAYCKSLGKDIEKEKVM